MVGLDGPYTYGREVFGDFFEITLIVLGVIGLLTFLYLLLRTFVQAEPPSAERRRRAEEIVRRWGDDTLDYFALRRDKNYFFSSDGQLADRLPLRARHGDGRRRPDRPARPTRRGRSTSSSPSAPSAAGASPSSPCARPTPTSTRSAACTRSTSATRRSSIRDKFSLEGAEMKAARTAVKHVAKDHSFELIAETEASQELIAELNEISAEWRDGSPERGFTMELGEEVEGTNPDFVIAIAREQRRPGRRLPPLRPRLRRGTGLLARPDAPPARLGQRA